ncbi:MAG: tetratricopeptide repeat protein [bacterium]|nr:tetratricopeptide repeat protein [bacterium]
MTQKHWIVLGCVIAGILVTGVIGLRIYHGSQASYAETLFEQGDYKGVIDYLAPKTRSGHGGVDIRLLLAEAYYRLRRFDEAKEIIQPHLEFGREDPRAVALAGWMMLDEGDLLPAQERFTRLANLGKNGEADAGLAAVALEQSEGYKKQDITTARFHLSDALTNAPDLTQTNIVNARLSMMDNNLDGALEAAKKAVSHDPHWAAPHVMLGRVYMLADRYAEASDEFKLALNLGGSADETNYYLAQSLSRQGRLSEAQGRLDEIIKAGGEMKIDAMVDSAKLSLAKKQWKQAIDLLKAAWEEKPHPNIGMQLYEVYARLQRWDEADALLSRIIADRPFIPEALLERGNRLTRSGDNQRAYESYQNAVEQDPDNPWALFNLGCLSLETPQRFLAPEYFESAAQGENAYYPAKVNYALSLLANDRRDDARPVVSLLATDRPNQSATLRTQALERFLSGETESALILLDRKPADAEGEASLKLLKGEILLRVFQYEGALEAFESVLASEPNSIRAQFGAAHAAFRLGRVEDADRRYAAIEKRESTLTPEQKVEIANARALMQWSQDHVQQARDTWLKVREMSDLGREFEEINSALLSADSPTDADVTQLEDVASKSGSMPEASYNLALLYQRTGRNEAATSTYTSLLGQYALFLPAIANLGDLYMERLRYSDAAQLFDRAHRAAPERIDLLNNLAAAHYGAMDASPAAQSLDQALQLKPGDPTLLFNRGVTALLMGDVSGAKSYRARLQATPGGEGDRWFLEGLIDQEQGEVNAAETAFSEARKTLSNRPYLLLNQGIALAMLSRFDKADEAMKSAVSLDSTLAPAYRALGIVYGERGLYQESLELLRISLAQDYNQADVQDAVQRLQSWRAQETN